METTIAFNRQPFELVIKNAKDKAFVALARQCLALELPTHYVDDVIVHDESNISRRKPPVFGWAVGTCGSHFICPVPASVPGGFDSIINGLRQVHADSKTYFWNGEELRPVTINEMHALLADFVAQQIPLKAERWRDPPIDNGAVVYQNGNGFRASITGQITGAAPCDCEQHREDAKFFAWTYTVTNFDNPICSAKLAWRNEQYEVVSRI